MRPIDVKPKDELKIWMRTQQPPERRTEPAAVGDVVRVSSAKKIFDKGYLPNWSEVVYKVDSAIRHPKRVYKLRDETGDVVKGTFYKEHIQPTSEDIKYIIEKVIRKRKTGDNTELYVKWKGWPAKFNSWIAETELTKYGE
jgi:DNA-directed RNA polymerase subunit F